MDSDTSSSLKHSLEDNMSSEGSILVAKRPRNDNNPRGNIPAVSIQDIVSPQQAQAYTLSQAPTSSKQLSDDASLRSVSNTPPVGYIELQIAAYLKHIGVKMPKVLRAKNTTAAMYQIAKASPKRDAIHLANTIQWKTRIDTQSVNCILGTFVGDIQVNRCTHCQTGVQPFEECIVVIINGQKKFLGACLCCAWTRNKNRICSFRTQEEAASQPNNPNTLIPFRISGPQINRHSQVEEIDNYLARVQISTGATILHPSAIRSPVPEFFIKKVKSEGLSVRRLPKGFGSERDYTSRYDEFLDISSSSNFRQKVTFCVTMTRAWEGHKPAVWVVDRWHTWVCILRKLSEGSPNDEFDLVFWDEKWMLQNGTAIPSGIEEMHHLVSAAVSKGLNIKRVWFGGKEIGMARHIQDHVRMTMWFLRFWCSGHENVVVETDPQEMTDAGYLRMSGFGKNAFGDEWNDPEWPGDDSDPKIKEGRGLSVRDGGF